MSVLFSILIPAYKSAFLDECIESVLQQTYNNFEVIIVDDASPEDLRSIVGKYQDNRISYHRNDVNYGALNVVKNWNKCLEYSKGDYVICMGDDDRLAPHCLEEYVLLIEKHPGIGLLHGWTRIINERTEPTSLTTHRCDYESAISLIWHKTYAYPAQYIGDFCFKSDLLKEDGGFYELPLAWGSDEISSFIAANHNGVVNTQKVVFEYRVNSLAIGKTGNIRIKIKSIELEKKWILSFLSTPSSDENDELYRKELLKNIPHLYEKKKALTMIPDMRKFGSLVFWLTHRKEYQLNIQTILFAKIRSIL